MSLEQKYYRILNIEESASLKDVKRAYWERAKKLHPDKNNSPKAKEHFILLQEAYEYASKVAKGEINPKKSAHVEDFVKWWFYTENKQSTDSAHEKAQRRAKMKYNKYIKDIEDFQEFYNLNRFITGACIVLCFITLIIFPIGFFLAMGVKGLLLSLALGFILTPFYAKTWYDTKDFITMERKAKDLNNN